ncbi:Uncharacterised protein [Enterobacter cloacae]|uniref:Uncharacterized protein n=1 Tax=Enterobacter cloacae TaxID=550 RepID=A0A377M7H5_ENTCL|nr:Uncharacterised protein [Enterobacter cloacae]
MAVRLFNAVQTRIQRLTPQAGEREHSAVPLLKRYCMAVKPIAR